jgi:CHAP domain
MASADQIVQIAAAYSTQNITEIQTNNGWTDDQYQTDMESVGWEMGDEWCAAAAILDWKKGYEDNPDVWAHASRLVSLNSQQLAENFHADPVWPTSTNVPKPGAFVVWQEGDSATQGHCGIVVAINGNQFTSVEGNTSSPDQPSIREGWTVAQHTHTIGLPHSTMGLNLDRFVYAIESYDPLVV